MKTFATKLAEVLTHNSYTKWRTDNFKHIRPKTVDDIVMFIEEPEKAHAVLHKKSRSKAPIPQWNTGEFTTALAVKLAATYRRNKGEAEDLQ